MARWSSPTDLRPLYAPEFTDSHVPFDGIVNPNVFNSVSILATVPEDSLTRWTLSTTSVSTMTRPPQTHPHLVLSFYSLARFRLTDPTYIPSNTAFLPTFACF